MSPFVFICRKCLDMLIASRNSPYEVEQPTPGRVGQGECPGCGWPTEDWQPVWTSDFEAWRRLPAMD